jgi:hypothetical protein
MNTTWFWFEEQTRRHYHGTPADVMRKFDLLAAHRCLADGLEIYIDPTRLRESEPFDARFYRRFASLRFRSVHIGQSDADFLDHERCHEELLCLRDLMEKLEADRLIIHAHHFQRNRIQRKKLLQSALGSCSILIENNGFDSRWGGSIQGLETIFADCPEFRFCLDIAHVKDFPGSSLDDFLDHELLMNRLQEIHYSYSTILLPSDPYAAIGFSGYGPYHALFSVLGIPLSSRTLEFVHRYPIVLEGVAPTEDTTLEFLKREISLLRS